MKIICKTPESFSHIDTSNGFLVDVDELGRPRSPREQKKYIIDTIVAHASEESITFISVNITLASLIGVIHRTKNGYTIEDKDVEFVANEIYTDSEVIVYDKDGSTKSFKYNEKGQLMKWTYGFYDYM